MVFLCRPYHFKFFKGCLSQILLGPFLNTLSHTLCADISMLGVKNYSNAISEDQICQTITLNYSGTLILSSGIGWRQETFLDFIRFVFLMFNILTGDLYHTSFPRLTAYLRLMPHSEHHFYNKCQKKRYKNTIN